MVIEVKVPRLPESVADATLVTWHKAPGDSVERDENLADLETDKVVLEVPAPQRGVLREIRVEAGSTVTSGQLLAIFEAAADGASAGPAAAAKKPVAVAAAQARATPAAGPPAERNAGKTGPAVRRLAAEQGVDTATLKGSGPQGRIQKSDVVASPVTRPAPVPEPVVAASRSERRVPMTRLRARIAERLVTAQQTAAMLTTFNEVDLSEVMSLRSRYKEAFEKQHGARLGFMGFFIKAAIEALRRYPGVNASIEGQEIVYHDYYDIGVAVSTDRGLVVPVLRDAERLSLPAIEAAITEFGRKARDGTLGMDDLIGGTFTLTNGGVFGSMLSTPILNPPQSGILGMHKIQERPMVVDGQIVVRPMMYLALTYDHRIVDGREAVQFLVAIKETLEDPARLLLGI
ncbi:MAG: 2-oxoglutarate dehydrogenase complex dihydrolipoyllysine-residue succinyltransferase [Chromatiales bacterium]|nr:2-oxoglutarate dehydrogenase complex dihydrolipoyllysine-residue succinyltransferase [Chromatiales bacterium]